MCDVRQHPSAPLCIGCDATRGANHAVVHESTCEVVYMHRPVGWPGPNPFGANSRHKTRRTYPQTSDTINNAKRAADEEKARIADLLASVGAFDVIARQGLSAYVTPMPEAS